VEFTTPLSHNEERIDAYHDDEPLRYRTMENLLGDDGEPRSFAEAERHAAWRAAMQSEMDVVEKNCT
jgi:hypothetical protein